MRPARTPRRGFAALIVLWTMGLLALMGAQLLSATRQDAQQTRNDMAAAEIEAAGDAALQRAIFATLDQSNRHWPADGIPRLIQVDTARVMVRIEDETRKLNPNLASVKTLQALLIGLGADPATAANLAVSIRDWRVGANVPGRANALIPRYRAAGLDYAPSGLPFSGLDELGAVLGMTPLLLERMEPFITLYTDQDAANFGDDITTAVSRPQPPRGSLDPSILSISIDAAGKDGARLAFRCIVRLNAQARGRRWEVLFRERRDPNVSGFIKR